LGIHPRDWMLNKVPVLPPQFRPISIIEESEVPLVSDANYLYKELIDANDLLRDMRKEVDDVGEERLAVYNAFKAVTGLGDPTHPKLKEKRVTGLLKHIFGSSPKLGTVQRRLLSSPVDLVGRAVIAPNPDLDMDHVGLPENRAWDVYRDFVVRRLKRRGMSLLEAMRHAKDRTPQAKEELLKELEYRPVYINRAPVLHRFGVMAFWPKLVKGDTLQISPLIVKGFNADFDGDAMQYHVPVEDEAREEAISRMMPSSNLLSPGDFKSPMHTPGQEYIGGLYAATRQKKSKQSPRYFPNEKEAIEAYRRGDISIDTPVRIRS
jgi:DNA-directed RNA polymerase subunit beta'